MATESSNKTPAFRKKFFSSGQNAAYGLPVCKYSAGFVLYALRFYTRRVIIRHDRRIP
jgi:hypothetical protein